MSSIDKQSSIRKYIMPKSGLWLSPLFYLQLLTLAELITVLRDTSLGLILHSVILLVLLFHGALEKNIRNRRFLLSLALAPLIRLLSLSLPSIESTDLFWYLTSAVGSLLFIAAYYTARITELSAKRIGLTIRDAPFQLLFGFTGIGIGYLEYLILSPAPRVAEFSFEAIWFPALILIVFTGVLEEIIFRGIIQQASLATYGRFGILFVAVLFAILHIGWGSLLDVIFVFGIAWLFGIVAQRTGSLLGVSISHSLTNICLFLIFPFLLGSPSGGQQGPIGTSTPTGTLIVSQSPKFIYESPTHDALAVTGTDSDIGATIVDITSTATATPTQENTLTPTLNLGIATSTEVCGKPAGWVKYTVKAGDTLFKIGQAYGVSVSDLQQANCMGSSVDIFVNDSLYVPNVAPNTPPPTATSTPLPSTATPTSPPTFTPTIPATNTPVPTYTETVIPSVTPTLTPTP